MLKTKYEEANIALFVDGPNMLRKEFSIDLRELRKRASKYGRLIIAKVFVNQFAPEKLIEAIINEGFEVEIGLAVNEEDKNDVDVMLAVEAMEAILTKDVNILALATRDTDFLPLIQKAKEHGKKVIIFAAEPGLSASLKNSADLLEIIS
ncbi:MAG: NYN domain-containing protein [Candidatus Aenigmatarchaeota archaeon]